MSAQRAYPPRLMSAVICLLFGCGMTALALDTILEYGSTATTLMSPPAWEAVVKALDGHLERSPAGDLTAEVNLTRLLVLVTLVGFMCWGVGAAWISFKTGRPFLHALSQWGRDGWRWWLLPGLWEALWIVASLSDFKSLDAFLLGTPAMWLALTLAGWLATLGNIAHPEGFAQAAVDSGGPSSALNRKRLLDNASSYAVPVTVWIAVALYIFMFTTMNWQLYRGLLVPHGDSAMYEEHLWNVTHGKGFRSYLDQGLFLGEHVQVIHLLLIPLYLIWPSHLLLELCETTALALGAVAVFWIGRRHTGCEQAGVLLALAYLLYFPMQFLDMAIDLKTFRPISFGVPLMLFALDQLERGRLRTMLVLLLLALSAKEDYALVLAPLGVWMALRSARSAEPQAALSIRRGRWWGGALAVFSLVYLVFVTGWLIPWFRGGHEVHYVRYFSRFGNTLDEIAWNMLTHPGRVAAALLSVSTAIYALSFVLPLGFLPLRAPGRLAVALPLFVVLCLNEIAQDPRHHFHAPLVPVLLWAAAAGLGTFYNSLGREPKASGPPEQQPAGKQKWGRLLPGRRFAGYCVLTSALATGWFFSLSPLGFTFWDSGSAWYWRKLYVPGKRAEMFSKVIDRIPHDARVFSTDFVHPRFTHYARSYDYSDYPRKSDAELKHPLPGIDYYIVIDTQHPYSKIKTPVQVPEYRDHPETWELLSDLFEETDGYFIVLKRRP